MALIDVFDVKPEGISSCQHNPDCVEYIGSGSLGHKENVSGVNIIALSNFSTAIRQPRHVACLYDGNV